MHREHCVDVTEARGGEERIDHTPLPDHLVGAVQSSRNSLADLE